MENKNNIEDIDNIDIDNYIVNNIDNINNSGNNDTTIIN